MFDFKIWLDGLAVLAVFAATDWLLSLPLRNASIVDSMWSLMSLLVAGDWWSVAGRPRAA